MRIRIFRLHIDSFLKISLGPRKAPFIIALNRSQRRMGFAETSVYFDPFPDKLL
jgi:hypothetical protein